MDFPLDELVCLPIDVGAADAVWWMTVEGFQGILAAPEDKDECIVLHTGMQGGGRKVYLSPEEVMIRVRGTRRRNADQARKRATTK